MDPAEQEAEATRARAGLADDEEAYIRRITEGLDLEAIAEAEAEMIARGVPPNRARIAAIQNVRYTEAVAACGPDAFGYMVVTIVDSCGLEPDFRFYCCRHAGQLGWHPDVTEVFGRLGELRPPGPWNDAMAFGFPVPPKFRDGETVGYPHRFTAYHTAVEHYRPATQAELDAARAERQAREMRRQAASLPLFSDQILSEEKSP